MDWLPSAQLAKLPTISLAGVHVTETIMTFCYTLHSAVGWDVDGWLVQGPGVKLEGEWPADCTMFSRCSFWLSAAFLGTFIYAHVTS